MAKLADLPLEELYSRKITSSVEKIIAVKDSFQTKNENWCNKVCRLKNKNPPQDEVLVPSTPTDVLIIQDYQAFDEPKFFRYGATIEKKHLGIINYLASNAYQELNRVTPQPPKSRPNYQISTLLKCQLKDEDLRKGGKAPTEVILSKCSPYLFKEIELRKPKVILSLSTSVSKLLLPGTTNNGSRGEVLLSKLGVPFIPTLHPRILLMLRQNSSGKFWGPDYQSIIELDFKKAFQLALGLLKVPVLSNGLMRAREQIHIARSLDDVKAMVAELSSIASKGNIMSVDTETTGLDPYSFSAKLLTIQFGIRINDVIKVFVFPLWHRNNTWYSAHSAWELISPVIENETFLKTGHNLKFDILYIAATTGVRMKGVEFDTMLLLHSINSGLQGQYGLKQAVHDYLPEFELGGYEDQLPKLTKKTDSPIKEESEDDD
jgi:hypothetical protein